MKKHYYLFAVAALALASCSSDEIIESTDTSPGSEIAFRATMEATTRAADISATNLNTFNVTAFRTGTTSTPFMDNVAFTKNGVTYTSVQKYFWPENNLDFYAFAPTDGAPAILATTKASGNQIQQTGYKSFIVTPSSSLTSQVDLIFAKTRDKGKTDVVGGGLPLNFRHAGSKIVVRMKNSQPNLKFEVSAFKIVNVDGSAIYTYDTTYNTDTQNTNEEVSGTTLSVVGWTNNTEASEKNITYSTGDFTTPNVIPASQATGMFLNHAENTPSTSVIDEDLSMILIPQETSSGLSYSAAAVNAPVTSGSYIAVKMVIKNSSDNAVIANANGTVTYSAQTYDKWAMWPLKIKWDPGKKYIYTIDLGDGGYWEVNNDTDTDLDQILENAEIKFANVTVDEWDAVAKPVVKIPETLAEMKTYINQGVDCSEFIGYYVDASGNISKTNISAIGAIAGVREEDMDEGVPGSRILVVALTNANGGAKTVWDNAETLVESGITHENSTIKDYTKYNGYLNTQRLYTHPTNAANYLAAKAAWEYDNTKIGTPVLTGSSPWFLPSLWQANFMMVNRSLLQNAIVFLSGGTYYYYWSSNECSLSGDPTNNAFGFTGSSGQEANKKKEYPDGSPSNAQADGFYVRSVFVY